MSTTAYQRLPLEVLERIADLAAEGSVPDHSTLRAMALTCRALKPRYQFNLLCHLVLKGAAHLHRFLETARLYADIIVWIQLLSTEPRLYHPFPAAGMAALHGDNDAHGQRGALPPKLRGCVTVIGVESPQAPVRALMTEVSFIIPEGQEPNMRLNSSRMPVADVQTYFFDKFFAPIHLRILRSLWLNAPSTTLGMDNGDLRSQIRIALVAPANVAFPGNRIIFNTTPMDAPCSNTGAHRTGSSTLSPSRECHLQSGWRSPAGKPTKNWVTTRRSGHQIPLSALGQACSELPSHSGERDVPSLKRRRVTSPAPRKRRRVGDSASDTEYSNDEEWLPHEDVDGIDCILVPTSEVLEAFSIGLPNHPKTGGLTAEGPLAHRAQSHVSYSGYRPASIYLCQALSASGIDTRRILDSGRKRPQRLMMQLNAYRALGKPCPQACPPQTSWWHSLYIVRSEASLSEAGAGIEQ
ncbi:hypothetical protein NUW54_g7030 [Trametes sanguinea]|uniref:Uncharacterized protein n=1 Tax=Trametes sanguinea TaxID=158606 RepID=A0ACC1PR24_9APHY|nr:hypothetical protein NUW54_g7030 [Trametes sanguinea]